MDDYSGLLGPDGKLFISVLGSANKARLSEHMQKIAARENALFLYFAINQEAPDAWKQLALSLAEKHVPAYRNETGRPGTNLNENTKWLMMFNGIKRRDGCKDAEAYRKVADTFVADFSSVKERIKAMRKKSQWQGLEKALDKIETEIGRDKLAEILISSVREDDPEFTAYVQAEAKRLERLGKVAR